MTPKERAVVSIQNESETVSSLSMMRTIMQKALEALEKSKQSHHYCEDTWYSCPKHEDGCANDAEGDK